MRKASLRQLRLLVFTVLLCSCFSPAYAQVTDSPVSVKEATFWQQYRMHIIGATALFALQTALILALLVERSRRRKADMGLNESQERNRAMLSALPDLMFLQSRDGLYLDYHASSPELLLVPPEQFMGKRMREVLPSKLAREMEFCFAQAIETRETQIVEYDLAIQGKQRWFEARIAPCSGTRLLSVVRDVTDRRQAEVDLRNSEDRFAKVFMASPQPMALSTLHEGRYVYVNDSFLEISGYQRGEVIGHTAYELQIWETPDERGRVVRQLMNSGAIQSLETRFRTKNNEVRVLLSSAELLHFDGEPFILVASSDITKRKQLEQQLLRSEREFSTLVENSPDFICRLDQDLRYIYVSPNIERISGVAARLFIGKTQRELALLNDDPRGFESSYREAISKRHTIVREFKSHGRHYRTRIIPELSAGGGVESIMSITEDFTEQLRAELELRDLTARLIRLQDEERRRLARELHDGAAQNVFAISLNINALQGLSASPTAETTRLIDDTRVLAEQSLTELRTLSYLLHPPTLDYTGLVRAIEWFVDGFSKRSGIGVDIVATDDIGRLPPEVETALFRIVQESLTNVRCHSGSETATIRIEKANAEVRLSISDHGHGMRENGGTGSTVGKLEFGVGIPGIRQRLRQLGGRLEIESTSSGTTITAVVPAIQRVVPVVDDGPRI